MVSKIPEMVSEPDEVTFKATGSFEREPIAIVGMAARFPQEARTVEDLWNFLLQARQAMTDFPADRISSHAHYHPDAEHGGTVSMLFFSPLRLRLLGYFFSIYKVTQQRSGD
jgi:Beta-ketoacyl synthase, N-terminal domain